MAAASVMNIFPKNSLVNPLSKVMGFQVSNKTRVTEVIAGLSSRSALSFPKSAFSASCKESLVATPIANFSKFNISSGAFSIFNAGSSAGGRVSNSFTNVRFVASKPAYKGF